MNEYERAKFAEANKGDPRAGQSDVGNAALELSPLDQIQSTELEVERQIAIAREAAELLITRTKAQLADLRREAQETGSHEGQTEYNKIVLEAEEAAKVYLDQACQKAERFRCKNAHRIDALAQYVTTIILGMQD
jgi:vacuolar-type H+-ATPase subunit H